MVWSDTGSCIRAYCVPDSFSGQSKIDIHINGSLFHTMGPNDFNEHMAGRHETGRVGFIIDNSIVDGLEHITNLELRETESDILIYRRHVADKNVAMNIFRLETHIFPMWRIDAALKENFRFWYHRIEQFSPETARQILSFHCYDSLYSSGRILYNNYGFYLGDRQKTVMMMQDPFDELAERLFIFNHLGQDAKALLGDRDSIIFAPILDLASNITNFDEKELRQILGKANPQTLYILSNPITRQLTAATPDENVKRASIARALSYMSEFEVVGIRDEAQDFTDALSALVGVPSELFPTIKKNDKIAEISAKLRALGWIDCLIDKDLEVYAHLKAAMEKVKLSSASE